MGVKLIKPNDPILLEIEREKERKKYQRKKQKGQVKLVNDIKSRRELKAQRKAWRERSKRAYHAKKNLVSLLMANSPPYSDEEVRGCSSRLIEARQNSERKRVRKERAKVVRENKTLTKKMAAKILQTKKTIGSDLRKFFNEYC